MANRAARNGMMAPSAMEGWKHPLADLIVTPERAAEIQKQQPFEDTGRPLLFAPSEKKHASSKKPRKDATWRSFESDDEELLAEEEFLEAA